jgi:hypothetical protein
VPVTGAPNSDVVKTTAAVRTAAAAPTASAIRARRRRIGAALCRRRLKTDPLAAAES